MNSVEFWGLTVSVCMCGDKMPNFCCFCIEGKGQDQCEHWICHRGGSTGGCWTGCWIEHPLLQDNGIGFPIQRGFFKINDQRKVTVPLNLQGLLRTSGGLDPNGCFCGPG